MLPDPVKLRAFWQEQVRVDSPRLKNNPMLSVPNWMDIFIPVFLHGDGASVIGRGKSWQKSLDTWHWGSVLAHGPTAAISLMICSLFAVSKAVGLAAPHRSTMRRVFMRLKWSFEALFEGFFPQVNDLGTTVARGARLALAGGYRAILYVIEGDLDYLAKDLGLPHYSAASCCLLVDKSISCFLVFVAVAGFLRGEILFVSGGVLFQAAGAQPTSLTSLGGSVDQESASGSTCCTPAKPFWQDCACSFRSLVCL